MVLFSPANETHHWWTDSVPLWQQQTFPRLILALVLGICVGAERQWRQRAAGLRTNTLVCLGAAAFVDLGLTVAPNTTQVIAYVVSGVGFLGAGAIMKEGANVRGLNTAATLWCSAAVGACVGAGELLDGIFVAGLLIAINSALRPLSRFIDRRSLAASNPSVLFRLSVISEIEHTSETEQHLTQILSNRAILLRELRRQDDRESATSMLQVVLESQSKNLEVLQKVVADLRLCPWVKSVDVYETDPDSE
ncbi:MgtC/SapB family protein [Silvibacterium sp.]|uniref:MgtC/SapB family protein n=1 Tax=Silvibacterium sp. TaxID=1964179 RepID=UPI0039E5B333